MIDIKQALREATTYLTKSNQSGHRDSEILLSFVLQSNRAFLYAHAEKKLSTAEWEQFQALIHKRQEGVPIAYLTECREFWSLPLCVSKDTLIPRPETELLVALTLDRLTNAEEASVLDLGTGSGAVALALASERPRWKILASDVSKAALQIAEQNATNLALDNVLFYCSNWFDALPKQRFNAIVSNPPYIALNDPCLRNGDLRFEPQQALTSGKTGLEALTQIISEAHDYLLPDGLLVLEHGYEQGKDVIALLQNAGFYEVQCVPDIQGLDRVSIGRNKNIA